VPVGLKRKFDRPCEMIKTGMSPCGRHTVVVEDGQRPVALDVLKVKFTGLTQHSQADPAI
jgi:hypothetical protein